MRGYACVGLMNPKSGENVGGVMRACGVYGAAAVFVYGTRFDKFRNHPTDTMKAWRHIPVIEGPSPLDVRPYDCQLVAVEIVDEAVPLPSFSHPERALYLLGPEDGSIQTTLLVKAQHVVQIPTMRCMNLAATANVVLYDRLAKGSP